MCLVAATACHADVIVTPWFAMYWDTATTFNGELVPEGSVIDAYDPQGIHCGRHYVGSPLGWPGPGNWGILNVYGDDPYSGQDEGAIQDDSLSFEINGHAAEMTWYDPATGYRWADRGDRMVRLNVPADSVMIAITPIELPDWIGMGWAKTVRVSMRVRNDGNGIDFYSVSSFSPNPHWTVAVQDSFTYADPADTVAVYFDVTSPLWTGGFDTTMWIHYSVYSNLDPTVRVDDSVLMVVSITDAPEDPGNLPGAFELYQNYPNPFNPTTTISFHLNARSQVRLDVFNVLGRAVATFDLGVLSAQTHYFEYDASRLPSGVYFYRIRTDGYTESKKMILLK